MIGRSGWVSIGMCPRPQDGQAGISGALLAGMLVLGALAAIYFAWPVYRAFLPLQILFSDAWNAYHADAIRAGLPLYEGDYFLGTNYPPLSFYLTSALSAITHADILYVGRLLSLAATIATAGAIWVCVRVLGGSRLAATLGAVWWLASIARWYSTWIGIDDPHVVALALMTWSLAYALRHPNSDRALFAVVLMAVAGFYKHSLVAIPTTTLIWLALHDRRRGLYASVIGLGTVAAGLAICGALFGVAFFHDMLLPRVYHWSRGPGHIGLTQFIAPALVIAVTWAAYRRQTPAGRFILVFTALALASYLGESVGEGVFENAIFELTVAAAIGLGCAFGDLAAIPKVRSWGIERTQLIVVAILIGRLLLSPHVAPYLFLFSPSFRAGLNERIAIMKAETARIAAIPGPVACDYELACRFAGKPLLSDPFVVGQYVGTGRISQQDVDERIKNMKLRFEKVDPRVDVSDLR